MKSILSGSKDFFLICWMLVSLASLSEAQTTRKSDVIITKDNEKIEAVIQEIDAGTIRYRKVSDPDGPVFTLSKTDVSSILYGNGEVEKFDKSTDEYFAPGAVPPPVIYKKEPEGTYNKAAGQLSERSAEQLRSNYNLYIRKSNSYRKLGFIGASAGLLFTVVGTVILSKADNYYNGTGTYVSDDETVAGALLFMTGLGAGIPLTIVGFIKHKKYAKRAIDVQNELKRRSQPLSLHLAPGYDLKTNAGFLSLRMTF